MPNDDDAEKCRAKCCAHEFGSFLGSEVLEVLETPKNTGDFFSTLATFQRWEVLGFSIGDHH